MKHIGNTLAQIIEERNITQKSVADKMKITTVYMSKILRKDSIDCALLERFCQALDVPPSMFFDTPEQPQTIVGNNNIQAVNCTIALAAKEREVELLKELLADKERTIKILMDKLR